MFLNEYGQIAEQQWQWMKQQYPYIVLPSFVVMPNHIHSIIEIDDRMEGTGCDPSNENGDRSVGTGRDLSLQQQEQQQSNNDGDDPLLPLQKEIKIKSLSELRGAYKSTTSKQIHLLQKDRSQPVLTNPSNGNDHFTITLYEMKNLIYVSQTIFKTVLRIGKRINFIPDKKSIMHIFPVNEMRRNDDQSELLQLEPKSLF